MTLSYAALIKPFATALLKMTWIVLLLLPLCPARAQKADVKEVKKEADRRFDEEDYDGAYKLYSQLVANFPKDPVFNYRLGVCMIYSEPDKKKAIPYLKTAVASTEDAPKEAQFYLGKAYHVNYRFDEAIQNYNKFKSAAPASLQKKLEVDREIAACQHGKKLLSNLTDLVVQNKRVLNEADYFRTYDLKSIGGKLLTKPDDFKTSLDKKKKDRSVIFLPRSGDVVYYSSYGDGGENGRDIYFAPRLMGGGFGKPQQVQGINTPFDEDYPFLHPDGRSLYFASKGHNSMGGYDIFRSTFDENTQSWGQPVNLEFPINSPDDDFLFVTDSLEQTAYFSTGRQSPPGKVDVLKIKTERKPADVIVIAGTVESETAGQSVESNIRVKDLKSGKDLTLVSAEPSGDYLLELPNGGKLLYTVSTPGIATQSQEVNLPLAKSASSYRQTISYEKGKLKISSDFDVPAKDDAYLQLMQVIEKKAKLEVNEGANQLEMPLAVNEKTEEKKETKTETGTPPPAVDNRELAKLARQDADESQQEAAQLEKDARDALAAGDVQKQSADRKLSEAADALKKAQTISDPEERKVAIEAAEKMKEEAKGEQIIADKVTGLARSLEEDAKNKKQVASLNRQYADELDKVVISGNPASLQKLEELREQIGELDTKDGGTAARIEDNRKNIAQKEEQAALIEKQNTALRADLQENSQAIANKQQALDKTRKKSKRAEISAELDNLHAERTEKEKELNDNVNELAAIHEDIEGLQQDIGLASNIKSPSHTGNPDRSRSSEPEKEIPVVKTAEPVKEETTPEETTPLPAAVTSYQPIATSDPAEADAQLQAIDKKIDRDLAELPSTEEFTELRRAQQKLKDDIAAARSAVVSPTNPPVGIQQAAVLNKEAEDFMIQAQKLRTEAKEVKGAEKDRKIAEARQKEEQANEKLVEAASITATDNYNKYNTGAENLETLLATGQGSSGDHSEATRLNEEAQLAFRQAAEIRIEAASLPTKGAQLGSLSNAEEKEAEALLKQDLALDLMKKGNPDVALKAVPVPGAKTDVASQLAPVNRQLEAMGELKSQAYNSAYTSNSAAIAAAQKTAAISGLKPAEQEALSKTGSLLAEAETLKSQSDNENDPDKKTAQLVAAVKKQNEALDELQKLPPATVPVATTPPPPAEETVNTVTVQPAEEKPETTEEPPKVVTTEEKKEEPKEETKAPEGQGLPAYLEEKKPELRNAQARDAFTAALSELDAAEKALASGDNPAGEPVSTLRTSAESTLQEAEKLAVEAQATRTRANEQEGAEKEATLASAGDIDRRSQEKMLEAAAIVHRANEAEIANNDSAINELLGRLKSEDPEKASLLEQRLTETDALRTQSAEIRQEATGLSNPAQRLGGMNNAEEKEAGILQVQTLVLDELKQKYSDYVQPQPVAKSVGDNAPALREKKYNALTNLTNALNLEFETTKNSVGPRVNAGQVALRKKAFDANARSKQLLVQASRENDGPEKENKLGEAVRVASEALSDLNRLAAEVPALASNTEPGDRGETKTETRAPVTTPATSSGKTTARIEGLEVIKGNAYNTNRKIPFNAPVGEGLMFRVQIGAFRTQLPDDAFRGLSPLNGESTASGYFRYTAGNFNKIENANAVKNDLRGLGYSNAFVVAYFNGKRITLAEALALMAKEGKTVDENAPQSAGITANSNIPRPAAIAATQPVPVEKELDRTNGLLYTIQIGVYNRQVTAQQLFNLLPVYREQLGNGLFRYTAGIYNNAEKLLADKEKVVALGIRDAFVSAYIGGRRVPFAEARNRQQSDNTIKPEPENPIVFPGTKSQAAAPAGEVKPFSNNVSAYPVATPENGVKNGEAGISFKVQIGAFSRQVPQEVAARFSQIKNWPVENKQVNNLYIYNVGNFSEARFARALKEEAVRLGITDAFVAVYRDGRKLYGPEAATLLSR